MKNILWLFIMLSTFSTVAQQKISSVKMSRTACKTKCPVFIVELSRNGVVTWQGIKNVSRKGYFTATMSKRDIAIFFAEFEKNDFKKLRPQYLTKAAGKTHLDLEIEIGEKVVTIKNAEEGPEFLANMGRRIDQKIKNLKWRPLRFTPPQIVDESDEDTPPQQTVLQEGVSNVMSGDAEIAEYPAQKNDVHDVLTYAEEMPEFPGGIAALMRFMQSNINYPEMARDMGISGKVYCRFVIDEQGNVGNITVVKGVGHGLDQEAMRVVKLMPRWTPGKMNKKPVKVQYTLPVNFVLR